MNGPRTGKEALIAEMLGDLDRVLDRANGIALAINSADAKLTQGVDERASVAMQNLDAATVRFGRVTTRSVDEFVGVANEALAKFMQRTNELKATLDLLHSARQSVPVVAVPEKKETHSSLLFWLVPLVFTCGFVIGATASFLATK